jgi:hypothetical protein
LAIAGWLLVSAPHSAQLAARASSFDKEEQCAAIARKTLDDFMAEFKASKSKLLPEANTKVDHESHYNSKMGKCFLYFSYSDTWYLLNGI